MRTDRDASKHNGISFLLIDMATEGVTTRPIRLISGASVFCETFFDNVKVPKENVVGEVNRGWDIAKYLLTHEREMISGGAAGYTGTELNKRRHELLMAVAGSDALDWDGVHQGLPADWLRTKANSIEGGTSEVMLSIISRRVLGLPG